MILNILNMYGEKTADSVYSLWKSTTKVYQLDDLIYKSNSWHTFTDFIEDYKAEDGEHYYVSQSMTEQDIQDYLHPSQERLDEIDAEYRAWAD